ncbi:MAG TPA: 3-deoxy-7-phosphoheptulonate synthase [Eubacteriaceae bacterium]|nr:3-deoxy-7-phosphoheptulonate synthase [Eubacteriaceae bacterium]
MKMKFIKRLPTKQEIIEQMPISDKAQQIREKKVNAVKDILSGKDSRFLLIIGPCSADNEDSVMDYIERLAFMQEKVADKLLLVPRIYTNKPRTTGAGYKGMMHQPDPSKEPNMHEGILSIRRLHLRSIEDYGMPAADEMLYPDNYSYLDDLLSYIAIGARSVENQQHRLTCSGVNVPVGMKNPTSGDFSVMLNAVNAAQHPHRFIYRGYEVESDGNPYAHAILRGAVNSYGRNIPNYHYEDLKYFIDLYQKTSYENKSVIIDTNHSNSMKQYEEQPRIAKEILFSRNYDKEIRTFVKGLMIESYIEGGSRKIDEECYGKSITDPCLGWNATEQLIQYIAEHA